MIRLKLYWKSLKHSVRNESLLIIILITIISIPIALHQNPTRFNQSELIKSPSIINQLNPPVNIPPELSLNKNLLPKTSQSPDNVDPIDTQVSSINNAFNGFNLISLERRNSTTLMSQSRRLLVMDMEGNLFQENGISFPQHSLSVHSIKFINSTTILYESSRGATLWNIYENKAVYLGLWGQFGFLGHHDFEYSPSTNTIFALLDYNIIIDGVSYRFDKIVEYNTNGQILWTFDTHSIISHTQWCPYRDMIDDDVDLTHSNSLFYDSEEKMIYLNVRNTNTFYKIDRKTGKVLWALGEYGNFTLIDRKGNQQRNLFYHTHAVEKVDENTFILFDNDFHNQTNPNNKRSRILEITINEATMTAQETWSWTAPLEYYSAISGDADRLPNGNRVGVFGSTWGLDSNIGARLVEVDEAGHIVWEMKFPMTDNSLSGVYRLERFRLQPVINSHPDIQKLASENVTVNWETYYNFRTNRKMQGSYTILLNGEPYQSGSHEFDKFWRPTNLSTILGLLKAGNYNLTVVLADEAGHSITDSLNISVAESFYLNREGPVIFEYGHELALLQWKGDTINPLMATLTINNTLINSFNWDGAPITLNLKSYDVGSYLATLCLYDNGKQVYENEVNVSIIPLDAPQINIAPTDQTIIWNESLTLSWELYDQSPASWNILINDVLIKSGNWDNTSYQHQWKVPLMDEGLYNITIIVNDQFNLQTSKSTWLTILPPNPPFIVGVTHQSIFQFEQENAVLSWEIHGGSQWILWINGTQKYQGEINSTQIDIRIENWERENWEPDIYNLTLQVSNENGANAIHTSWIEIQLNIKDAYADSIITGASMWYTAGDNALGPPDNRYTNLYADYGNGHVTLDFGVDEEILDGPSYDFTVFATGGEYGIFIGNNLSSSILVGTQIEDPLVYLGEGQGTTDFDISNSGLNQVRYIQIVMLTEVEVGLDAIEAKHYKSTNNTASSINRWVFPLIAGILILILFGTLWIRKKRQ